MQRSDWERLAAPFPTPKVTWRIEELASDGQSARLRPQLTTEAIAGRLDEVVGPEGWSFRLQPFGESVGCELWVAGVARSAIVDPVHDGEGAEGRGVAALARAAELFGLRPASETAAEQWVDYDPEEGLAPLPEVPSIDPAPAAQPAGSQGVAPRESADGSEGVKPEGQQAIDRLVERLKVEGYGLDAAKLLVAYGGYGSDPQAARELYGKLRELLSRRVGASA
jgi:hypothetical protein